MPDFSPNWRPFCLEQAARPLADRADELRAELQLRDPCQVAANSGVTLIDLGSGRGELHIPFWDKVYTFSWPELICSEEQVLLPAFQQTLLLYYLNTADGAPATGRWVSFADLPGGRFYHPAFQGYSGDEVVKAFGVDLDSFRRACRSAGGCEIARGDASFLFIALPRLSLMMTYWLGDEDFPSSCKVLFDESACHYLPIDGCALMGSNLVRRLLHPV
ncbi:MAG: DUF3786 domain-containing protein [Chloroflexi bacterium]|nr:DUF3786 domain-containing protein [Chloroflexota bacterium]